MYAITVKFFLKKFQTLRVETVECHTAVAGDIDTYIDTVFVRLLGEDENIILNWQKSKMFHKIITR